MKDHALLAEWMRTLPELSRRERLCAAIVSDDRLRRALFRAAADIASIGPMISGHRIRLRIIRLVYEDRRRTFDGYWKARLEAKGHDIYNEAAALLKNVATNALIRAGDRTVSLGPHDSPRHPVRGRDRHAMIKQDPSGRGSVHKGGILYPQISGTMPDGQAVNVDPSIRRSPRGKGIGIGLNVDVGQETVDPAAFVLRSLLLAHFGIFRPAPACKFLAQPPATQIDGF